MNLLLASGIQTNGVIGIVFLVVMILLAAWLVRHF